MQLTLPKDDYRNTPTKICNCCNKEKPSKEFKLERDKRATNGISQRGQCKTCMEHRKYKRFIKKTYNFSYDEYEKLFDSQGGKCAICESKMGNTKTSRLFVDHCHDTFKIRGLLCGSCNVGLGHFRDSPKLLRKALSYLSDGEVTSPVECK